MKMASITICVCAATYAIIAYAIVVFSAVIPTKKIQLVDGEQCIRTDDVMVCKWQGDALYTVRDGDVRNLVKIDFDRLQSAVLDATNLHSLYEVSYGFTPFDMITEPCEHVINLQRDVTVVRREDHGGASTTKLCVSMPSVR